MFSEEINKVSASALNKWNLLKGNKAGYLIASMLAGIYVGFGILLIFTIGGILGAANQPAVKIVMGISFGIALSLVIMAGSELFTGNNMVMTIGLLEKKVNAGQAISIWVYSFIGNLLGSLLLAWIFVKSGLGGGATGEFILKVSSAKMSFPILQLILRGILCNTLVCLAVWCSFRLKEEAAKLIMIFWCLFAFITTGFEHSVANMTLLGISLMIPHGAGITISGFIYNMAAVTLGNFIAGVFFVAFPYWYISKQKK